MDLGRVSSLGHALTLLEALGSDQAVAAGGSGVSELAIAVGRDKSQVSRMLGTLAAAGFAERDPNTRRYRLGWQVFALAARSGDQRLLSAARPVLTQLVRDIRESSHLSVLRGGMVLTVLTESPARALHTVSWAGQVVPASATSSGHALLFDHDRDQLLAMLGALPWQTPTPGAPRDVDDLYSRIQDARSSGYARIEEESEPELVSVGAPVRDGGGRIVAAVNISGPKFRLGRRLAATGETVAAAAASVSARLCRPLLDPARQVVPT
jgi:DNA-binding IclR family transcriptional regulator